MTDNVLTLCVGLIAQAFFSMRIIVQWILSERARRVLSPTIFWLLSLAGSWLLCLYGWLREDFAIVLGQFLSYYIYLWNLDKKGVWNYVPFVLRLLLILTPVAVASMLLMDVRALSQMFFCNDNIPLWLLLYGAMGQVLFTLRFVYQWYCSQRSGVSVLPAGFWILSLIGASLIISYGIMRHDIVLIIGQSFGIVAYARNLTLIKNEEVSYKR